MWHSNNAASSTAAAAAACLQYTYALVNACAVDQGCSRTTMHVRHSFCCSVASAWALIVCLSTFAADPSVGGQLYIHVIHVMFSCHSDEHTHDQLI